MEILFSFAAFVYIASMAWMMGALDGRISYLEKNTLKSGDFYVDKLKRVFARNLEYVPRKRGRLLGSKNKKRVKRVELNGEPVSFYETGSSIALLPPKRKRGRQRKDAVVLK